jgi:hypothetical protein
VERFLAGTLDFLGIPRLLDAAMERFGSRAGDPPDAATLIALDAEVRATYATGTIGASA